MKVPVSEAAGQLEARGVLKREAQDHSERVIEHVGRLLERELPVDLVEIDGQVALRGLQLTESVLLEALR